MKRLFVPMACLALAFSCFALSACEASAESKAPEVVPEEEAAAIIQSIELSGIESYGDSHSASEIQSNINSYSNYMTDEELTLCLEALGVAKCKEFITSEYKSYMKDPSSFEVVSYETTLCFLDEDSDEYYLSADMTYSGTNSYGGRMQEEAGYLSVDFTIDLESKTVNVDEGSLLSPLSLGL